MRRLVITLLTVSLGVLFAVGISLGTGEADATSPSETLKIDSLSRLYGPVTFEHSIHTEVTDSCADCHHTQKDLKQWGKATPCKSCHKTFDPDQKDKPGLKGAYHRTCFRCHEIDSGSDPAGCSGACHTKK
jgi:hypothetical protein